MTARRFQVTFDAANPSELAAFWAEALGYTTQPPPEGYATWEELAQEIGVAPDEWDDIAAIIDPDGEGPRLFFLKVPEPKTAKNRMHLDIHVADPTTSREQRRLAVDDEVARLIELGATKQSDFDDPKGVWTVMQDPEGNEFCVE